jgi:hypothetical protein
MNSEEVLKLAIRYWRGDLRQGRSYWELKAAIPAEVENTDDAKKVFEQMRRLAS